MGLPLAFKFDVSLYPSMDPDWRFSRKGLPGGAFYELTSPSDEGTTWMTAMARSISPRLARNIIYDGFMAYSSNRMKKGPRRVP
jgi:hypothetical protein